MDVDAKGNRKKPDVDIVAKGKIKRTKKADADIDGKGKMKKPDGKGIIESPKSPPYTPQKCGKRVFVDFKAGRPE